MTTEKQLLDLQRDYDKLKAENIELKKTKKFGLVWEEQSLEKNIDDKEHYTNYDPNNIQWIDFGRAIDIKRDCDRFE